MDFEVRRDDIRRSRLHDAPVPEPAAGEVVLRVQECALTANNITYAAFGEVMRYWQFFPADDGWGRVPVWGFAEVVASRAPGVDEGDRVYGYLPMSTHLTVLPGRVSPRGLVDTVAHRSALPPVYNQYQRVVGAADVQAERLQSVLRPLFTTSFLIDDWLDEQGCFGARTVVVASASSKTAVALAASLHRRGGVDVVGLTSARNAAFVSSVGYYDRTVAYGEIASLDPTLPTVLVDMGGDAQVLGEVHRHFGEHLRHSCQVGATHWDQVRPARDLPGPRPQMFFAPDQIQRRVAEWGSAEYERRVDAAYDQFAASARDWLHIDLREGGDAVTEAYLAVLDGTVPADSAVVFRLG